MTLSDSQQDALIQSVLMFIVLAGFIGFWIGESLEGRFRDKMDAIREGREDANGRKG